MLLVSHDRAFLDNVVSSTLVLEGEGRVGEYIGGYEDWLRQRDSAPQATAGAAATAAAAVPPAAPAKPARKLSYKDARELEQLPLRIDRLLGQLGIGQLEGQAFGQDFHQQGTTGGGIHQTGGLGAVAVGIDFHGVDADLDLGMQLDRTIVIGATDLGDIGEHHAAALGRHQLAGHVVQTQHHVLRRHDDGLAVGGREDVVGRHHQGARFQLRLDGQRHVHGHLIDHS